MRTLAQRFGLFRWLVMASVISCSSLALAQESGTEMQQTDVAVSESESPLKAFTPPNRMSEEEVRELLLILVTIVVGAIVLLVLARAFSHYFLQDVGGSFGPTEIEREDGYIKPSGRYSSRSSDQPWNID
ncbi:MAG: hypothetical protein KDD62_02985 [Bdellovibrionales bacterium]|nr:hypothetical protein [Bdellovibrionales bacterium]